MALRFKNEQEFSAFMRARNHAPVTPNQIPNTEPQREQGPTLVKADEGEAKSLRRTLVRFVGYRVKPLDPDNFAGSVKDLLDGLRHAGLIPGDEPWRIILETEQVKVKHYRDEMTTVEISS